MPHVSPVVDSVHRLRPGTRAVDRVDRLLELAAGQRVVDIGFVDAGRMAIRRADGTWLHDRLAAVADDIVGLDADASGVDEARALGVDAYAVDCTDRSAVAALELPPADIVIAGEVIEHIDRPGPFLVAMRELVPAGGRLVLTTPNGLSLTNVAAAFAHRELVNDDHVAWYSRRTLQTLLERHGWQIERLDYYFFPQLQSADAASRAAGRAATVAFSLFQRAIRPVLRVWPELADGLIVVARRVD